MPWFSPAEAAARLKIAPRTLRERAQKDPSIRNDEGQYRVDDEIEAVGVAAAAIPVYHDDADGHGSAYIYDETRDKYIFSLRSKAHAGRPFVLAGETARAMVQAYSRDGEDASINALSRTLGLHRTTVREVMRALGKTHDSAPFTDEDLSARTEEDLGEDLIRLKEERVLRSAERAQWTETKALADKARNFDRFVAAKLDAIVDRMPPRAPVSFDVPAIDVTPNTVVVGLTDLHFGAAAWRAEVGQETTREIVRARALATVRRLIARVLRFGRPSRWLLPAGSDNLHADTDAGTTTKGTPLDTDGSFARIFIEWCGLYEEIIGILAEVAPVEIVTLPGNHDRVASMMLVHWLAARHRDDPRVIARSAVTQRSYHLHGESLIGFAHGDGMKDDKIPLIMASEASEAWGKSRHRLVLTGHLHTDRSNEFAGVRVIHMPCLATADRWHHRNGYVGNTKAIAAYIVDDSEGLIATLPVQPPEGL